MFWVPRPVIRQEPGETPIRRSAPRASCVAHAMCGASHLRSRALASGGCVSSSSDLLRSRRRRGAVADRRIEGTHDPRLPRRPRGSGRARRRSDRGALGRPPTSSAREDPRSPTFQDSVAISSRSVSRLERDVIVFRADGYTLESDGHEIDAVSFEQLAVEGHRLLDTGRPAEADPVLEEALGLWRGPAYQGYRYTGFGAAEGDRLDELRRTATEDLIDSRLAAGDPGQLVAELEAMVREEPLRERRWGQLMVALYRAGRQAEALQAFARAREVLVGELGIEPGPELQRLQAAILSHDPELERGRPVRAERASNRCVPVQGARTVRDGGCGVLLRSGAGGRRGGRSPRRGKVPRARRTLGEWEVITAACGTHACPRIGGASGQRSVGLLRDPTGQPSARCAGSAMGERERRSTRCSPSTSSKRSSRRVPTLPNGPRSSTPSRRPRRRPTAPPRSSSRCERTSTDDAPSTARSHRCSPPTRSWSGRWTRTSSGGRSSFPRNERA